MPHRTKSEEPPIDLQAEVDRFFDPPSLAGDTTPVLVLILGGICAGKTTLRRQMFASVHVVIDAGEIFLSLSRGKDYDFPSVLKAPMDEIGKRVAHRAVVERRNIVMEMIGDDPALLGRVIDAAKQAGYKVTGETLTCDKNVALARNASRAADNISSYYTEPFHCAWILDAMRNTGALVAGEVRDSIINWDILDNCKPVGGTVCDVCTAAVEPANAHRIPVLEFRRWLHAGFEPDLESLKMMTSAGMTRTAAVQVWARECAGSTTDWLLCDNCYGRRPG